MAITTISGASSSDQTTLLGSELADSFIVKTGNVYVDGLEGNDTVSATDAVDNVTVQAGADNDSVTFAGELLNSKLSLDLGNDSVQLEDFTGSIYGSGGQDTIAFSATRTASNGLIRGDSGNDRLTFVNVSNLIVNGNADDDTISVSGTYANSTIYGGRQKDTISVGEITDGMVRGDANEDDITVTGALTNAIINGNAGGDQITFNTGANAISASTVYGGKGIDTIDLANTKGVYIAAGADGDDINIDASAPNTVYGGTGNDSVNYTVAVVSKARELFVDGEAGDDVITITETAEDANSVWLVHSVYGGTGDDEINATSGKELIDGGAGADTIAAGGGADTVSAGAGNDKVTSAAGAASTNNVSVTGGDGDDNFELAVGNLTFEDTINGESGTDKITVTTAAAFNMSTANQQAEKSFDNVSSIETLAAKFSIGDTNRAFTLTSKAQTAGIATIDSSEVTGTAGGTNAIFTVDASAFSSARALNFIGSDDDNVRDSFVGGAGNDTLSTGSKTVTGGDVLFGGGGVDTFIVEAASVNTTISDLGTGETFTVSSAANGADIAVKSDFTAGSGTINNKSHSAVTLTADAGVDVIMTLAQGNFGYTIASGSTAATITGSSFADSIDGGAGNDSLTGGGGNDTIQALNGNDTLKGGTGNDTFKYVQATKTVGTSTIDGETGTNTIDLAGYTGGGIDFSGATVSNIDSVTGVTLNSGGTINITGVGETSVVVDETGTGTTITGLDDQTSTILDVSVLTNTNWKASAENAVTDVDAAGEWFIASSLLTFYDQVATAVAKVTLTGVADTEISTSTDASVQTFTILTA